MKFPDILRTGNFSVGTGYFSPSDRKRGLNGGEVFGKYNIFVRLFDG
jgi:hypothetical protein